MLPRLGVEPPIQPKLALNSQASCLSLPSTGITGACHHIGFGDNTFGDYLK
jgi:hypothetical protein